MQSPKHGRTYRRGRLSRASSKNTRALGLRDYTTAKGNTRAIVGYKFHRASAKGEAPAVDSGELANSVRAESSGLTGTVSTSKVYARRLEEEMDRAAFKPALERRKPQFLSEVDEATARACK